MKLNDDLKYHIKIIMYSNDSNFGPGIMKIMKLVRSTSSLSESYRIMGLSPSKGWKIIKLAEESLGFSLFITTRGGVGGGQSLLTEEGETLLSKYEEFVSRLKEEGDKIFKEIF